MEQKKILSKDELSHYRINSVNNYFKEINKKVLEMLDIANRARSKGYDPDDKVEVVITKDMAERVEGLISIVAPQLVGKGIPERIKELEKRYGSLDWRVALKIAEETAKGNFCKFDNIKDAIEIGSRVGFLYFTLGIISTPLEGLVEILLKKRRDGKPYVAVKYAGPIRSAGGTGAFFSIVIVDYVRRCLGIEDYDFSEDEIIRSVIEVYDYHERVTNLQYLPKEEEIKFVLKHIKVQIDGEPTENKDVSSFKDLKRIDTTKIRGGMCLVIAEGLCQKAPKVYKRIKVWGKDFGLDDWLFLKDFIELQKKIKAKGRIISSEENKGFSDKKVLGEKNKNFKLVVNEKKLMPNFSYINDLVSGRPVLSHPLARGGFTLRYGRTRVSGFVAFGLHPSTFYVLNNAIAIGTQLKPERPSKGCTAVVCDSIEPPIVKLKTGDVIKLKNPKDAKRFIENDEIERILFLGNILVDYGDFSEFGHFLVPSSYCEEWWSQELERAIIDRFGNLDLEKAAYFLGIKKERIRELIEKPLDSKLRFEEVFLLSKQLKIPLHPNFILYWVGLEKKKLIYLVEHIKNARIEKEQENKFYYVNKIIFKFDDELKNIMEFIGLEHKTIGKEYIIIEKDGAYTLSLNLGFYEKSLDTILDIISSSKEDNIFSLLNLVSGFIVRDKAGTFIGARMGRPEKAKQRELNGSPQVLFPVGEQGGRTRSFNTALSVGKVVADFPIYYCMKCKKQIPYSFCFRCYEKAKQMFFCDICNKVVDDDHKHSKKRVYTKQVIDIKTYFDEILKHLEMKSSDIPKLIKGVRGTINESHLPENLAKGILRAKHGLYVNKDGTTRYDFTELPITHFKPKEIGTDIETLHELGYEYDVYGKYLEKDDQILELFPQDIILPGRSALGDSAADVLFRLTKFNDELLTRFYKLKAFYNINDKKDLVGCLVVGLAPHISTGMVGRIIGFSDVQALLAHPMWHAALKRDCDGDEAGVMLLMDTFLNFSRKFLPNHRGSTQDTPLVLTTKLIASEVDDQSHGLSVVWRYPLELYESAMEYKDTKEVDIDQIRDRVAVGKEFWPTGYTHPLSDFNNGVVVSSYKSLPSMEEKLDNQMKLARMLDCVDENDVARLVIEKHLIKDTKGNLRKFSMQQFRCSRCNEKYRRPPLLGKCLKCGGKIIFTISEGGIKKYLDISLKLSNEYAVPEYLKHSLQLLKKDIESIFGIEKEKQADLKHFLGFK